MCRCRPEVRTPCCGSPACHDFGRSGECAFCSPHPKPAKATNPNFYTTVTQSPQWKAWQKHQADLEHHGSTWRYDMAEVMECGWISDRHFQDFLLFSAGYAIWSKP